MNINFSTNVNQEPEAPILFSDLTSEDSAAISDGFLKKLFRSFKKAVEGISKGVSNFILDEVMIIAKNPWGWATGSQQRDGYDLDGCNRRD